MKDLKKFWSRYKLFILLVVFAGLSLASIAGVYSAQSTPVKEEKITTLATYRQTGKYYYLAEQIPSLLYENRPTMGPGEGTLYIKLVENLRITFDYSFICDRSTSIVTGYDVGMDVESPGKWVKHFTAVPENSVSSQGNNLSFTSELFVSVPWFEGIRSTIDDETGTSSSSYNLRIRPTIHTTANTDVGTVDKSFTAELVVNFSYGGAEGSQITVSGMDNASSGSIQRTDTINHPDVETHRYIFYALAAFALSGFIGSLWLFMMARPEKPEKLAEKMIAPFKEAMVEVAKKPAYRGQRAAVRMKSLEDLVYIAEGLVKPVLYLTKGKVHTFYVLDGPVRYEYSFKLPGKSGSKA